MTTKDQGGKDADKQAIRSRPPQLTEEEEARARQTDPTAAFKQAAASGHQVREQTELDLSSSEHPHWIELPFEDAVISAPAIHGKATSLHMDTGSWRILRPIIDTERCSRCGLCQTYCPDGAISFDLDGYPSIDYGHCKGCMICLVQCPLHAIESIPELEEEQCVDS